MEVADRVESSRRYHVLLVSPVDPVGVQSVIGSNAPNRVPVKHLLDQIDSLLANTYPRRAYIVSSIPSKVRDPYLTWSRISFSVEPRKGGYPLRRMYMMIPQDQTSHFSS